MTADHDTTRIVRSWLRIDEHESADRVLAVVLAEVDTTRQRRPWSPAWRMPHMNTYAKLALSAAAVLLVAVVGFNLLPGGGDGLGGGPAVTPTPTPSPHPSASPAGPSPGADIWPSGVLEIGRHSATMNGVTFSFDVPADGWSSSRIRGMIEKGSYPREDYRWIGLDMGSPTAVSTDPCAGLTRPVGSAVDDLATAMTTIPGTRASGPSDATVGGRPAKLVQLTIDRDIACGPRSFWLFGDRTIFPNTVDSVIKDWIFEVDGMRVLIHSDQAAPDPEIEREIQQIVDSIRLK